MCTTSELYHTCAWPVCIHVHVYMTHALAGLCTRLPCQRAAVMWDWDPAQTHRWVHSDHQWVGLSRTLAWAPAAGEHNVYLGMLICTYIHIYIYIYIYIYIHTHTHMIWIISELDFPERWPEFLQQVSTMCTYACYTYIQIHKHTLIYIYIYIYIYINWLTCNASRSALNLISPTRTRTHTHTQAYIHT